MTTVVLVVAGVNAVAALAVAAWRIRGLGLLR
jgi:hypothetical protein